MATPLPNDPANPCIGCGPAHPFGLRLAFERDGDVVRTRLTARPEWVGAPDRLHSAVLYLAMMETANWTVYGLLGRVGAPTRTSALGAKRWVAVGETIVIEGKRAEGDASSLAIDVEARTTDGALVATLQRAFDLPDADAFRKRFGYDELPAVYAGLL